MRSAFLLELGQREQHVAQSAERRRQDALDAERRLAEQLEPDEAHGKRLHAWVVLLLPNVDEATTAAAVATSSSEEFGSAEVRGAVAAPVAVKPPTAIFIEPSTGRSFEANDPGYLGIESVWNHENYYVRILARIIVQHLQRGVLPHQINLQDPIVEMTAMHFNLADTVAWEHLLPGEPAEQRVNCTRLDETEEQTDTQITLQEKHLDMPASWVNELHIGVREFEERFPNRTKVVHFMRAIYERFSPYHKKNGLTTRLTTYAELEYTGALRRWEWYTNRQDLLQVIAINFETKKLEEYFVKGRPDCLKCEWSFLC